MKRSLSGALFALAVALLLSGCGERRRIAYAELMDEDPQVRSDAARRLGEARAKEGVESLIAVLDDPDEEVRVNAVRSLGLIGDPSAVPALTEMVDDSLDTVRLQIAVAFKDIADPSAVPALARLLYDSHDTTRLAAARALGKIGGDDAINALIEIALLDEDEMVRHHVIREIGLHQVREFVPRLEDALLAEADVVRAKSAEVLGFLGDRSSVPALINSIADPFWKTRSLAAHSLAKIAPEDATVREALAKRLQVEDHQMTRVDIAWSLAKMGDRSRLEIVRTLLFKGDPADVRAEAARCLGDVGDETDLPRLERASKDKRGLVRREAYQAVEKLKEA